MKNYIITVFIGCLIASCQGENKFDEKQARAEIMKMHNAQRDYHFEKDSTSFVDQLSPDFISVNKGLITTPSREENLRRYNSYFSSVEFTKWDDQTEPILKFSEDGSLAYTIVDKVVEVEYKGENGEMITGMTHFAWASIYRKTKGGWKIESAISTNKPIEK